MEIPIKTFRDGIGKAIVVFIAMVFLLWSSLVINSYAELSGGHPQRQDHKLLDTSSDVMNQKHKPSRQLPPRKSLGGTVLDDAKYMLTSPLRIDATDALILGGVSAGIGGLIAADAGIRDFFQDNRGETSDDIANGLATVGSSYTFFAGNLGLIATGYWFRENEFGDKLYRTALISLESQVFTEAATGLVKIAAGRRRPNVGRGSRSFTPFQDFSFDRSFVSGHTSRAFSVAAVFADNYPQPVPFLVYSAASLMGVSRLVIDEHFSSDIFAGAALGFAIGKALSWRHKDKNKDVGLTILPYVPNTETTVGLTLHYTFH